MDLERYLLQFDLSDELRSHVLVVLTAMPAPVVFDLTTDAGFLLHESAPGRPFPIPAPGRRPARAVVLKRRMWRTDESFVRWVIAHELAHAHLRNAGRHPEEDPEHAADALAAEWGFARP